MEKKDIEKLLTDKALVSIIDAIDYDIAKDYVLETAEEPDEDMIRDKLDDFREAVLKALTSE